MKEKIVTACPACGNKLHIARLVCEDCGTVVEGDFARSRFEKLPDEDLEFIELFLRKRGNIKAVGSALDLSYPTVKNKLDQALKHLGFIDEESEEEASEENINILSKLSGGEMSFDEAFSAITRNRE